VVVQPPSGTVTFLFTDIEDSTRLWDSAPVDMATAVQAHDVVVRSAIERHDGYVFAAGGDGFCAAFSSAVDAITAAIESQRELGRHDAIPFAVRMALHTGEAIGRDGTYSGAEVNRAARLMTLAHGGQVLVSDTAEVLMRNQVALRRVLDAQQVLVDVRPAGEVIPGMQRDMVLHAGPPIEWERLSETVRAAAVGALLHEGLAADADSAERMASHGERRAAEMEESAATLRELGLDPLMVDSTVKRQREMGAIGKDEKVRASLTSGRAALLDAISAAKNQR